MNILAHQICMRWLWQLGPFETHECSCTREPHETFQWDAILLHPWCCKSSDADIVKTTKAKHQYFSQAMGGSKKDALAQLKRRQHRQHLDSNVKYMYWRFHLQGSLTKKLWSEACQSLGWNKSRRSYLALLMQKKGLNVSYALYMICMYKKLLNKW